MQATPKLQEIVTQIAEKHGVDLDKPGAYLRLEMPGHGQLVIQNIGAERISVTNYLQPTRDWVADPEIVVLVDYAPAEDTPRGVGRVWTPIESTELFGGWRLYAELDSRGDLVVYDADGQMELARYADNVVAHNLVVHGWLEQAERSTMPIHTWTDEEMLARDIRFDEVPF